MTANEVNVIERYLCSEQKKASVCAYFSMLGGRDVTTRSNIILKSILTGNLASKFSYLGSRNQKRSVAELNLHSVVLRAVLGNLPNSTEHEVNNCIKVWLKHAPQQVKSKDDKKNKRTLVN